MAFDLDFGNLARTLIKSGAPILGTVLGSAVGMPGLGASLGGMAADQVIQIAGKALGIDSPTPESLAETMATTKPEVLVAKFKAAEAEAAAKWPALAQVAVANAEVAKAQIEATEKRMQAELDAAGTLDEPWRSLVLIMQTIWRPLYALEGLVECAFFAELLYRVLNAGFFLGDSSELVLLNSLVPVLSVLFVPYMGARFALLGYYMKKRSDEKVADTEANPPVASGGLDVGSLVNGLLQAVIKKG